jgi:hypothetical protein
MEVELMEKSSCMDKISQVYHSHCMKAEKLQAYNEECTQPTTGSGCNQPWSERNTKDMWRIMGTIAKLIHSIKLLS